MKFRIGDLVKLREDHPYERTRKSNPLGIVGTVISLTATTLELRVKWENGTSNSYRHENLLPATKLDRLLMGVEDGV